jgi:hypothetical protein
MVRPVVVDIDTGFKKVMAQTALLSKAEILVGVQEGSKTVSGYARGRKIPGGVSIAQYAAENEFGTKYIPERSFMRSSFDENLPLIEAFVIRQTGFVIDGTIDPIEMLKRIGLVMQSNITTKIRQIVSPPNSPRTIAIKKSSKPLIDTGFMINAIRYTYKI